MVITVCCQKGGVGKTTTALELAAGLKKAHKKVLIVDFDSQMNTSATIIPPKEGEISEATVAYTAYDVITGTATAAKAIQVVNGTNIIAGHRKLSEMDIYLANKPGMEKRLKKALEPITGMFDFIVIDSPPALGTLTINALTAADGVIIPACPEAYGLQGISQLFITLDEVIEFSNRNLWIMGILLTRCRDLKLQKRLDELTVEAADKLKTIIYKTRIRESKDIKEAQAELQSVFDYAPSSIGAVDYKNFVAELLNQIKKGRK